MIDPEELFENVDPQFEESIRIDREFEATDEERVERQYEQYLDRYHLTQASVDFLEEVFDHIHAERPGPDERNHWLYGYYGSGKSHLLTALDLLLDTETLGRRELEAVWHRFDREGAHSDLGVTWQSMHDDVLVVPLSINLLRYQGVREQSFSEIILQRVYEARGFADRLDVAFFEEEFQREGGLYDTSEVWEQKDTLLNEILREEGVDDPAYTWEDVRRYRILSDIVLEGLTEIATGMTDNLADIQQRNIGQELAVKTIEAYRQELEAAADRPVKIVLLMDEVTLFIGGDYQRLSELNALAESIKDVGQGDIISVVTAQSNIEDVQPGLATKQLNFGILKDRFPQQYELPSRHAGEIVQRRLLAKSHAGRAWVEDEALTGSVHPQTMLVFRDITQNTDPPLDDIDEEAFIEYYPLLPYQPALFMEILSNLRGELADATKSIFSGTARAILALVAGLRERWAEKAGEKPIISLVDFYDLIKYELEDIIPEKTTVIDDIADEPGTTKFDVRVAKAVLLLSYVPDLVPQHDANIAAAIMDDLEGQPRANVQTQVRDSLEGTLEKFIRPDTSTDGSELRLTDHEEQQLISGAREFERDPDWDRVVEALDEHLWETIVGELDLPQSYEYEESDGESTTYPVGYSYEIDGQPLETATAEESVYHVDVVVRGLRPDNETERIEENRLYWLLETEGIGELRSQVVKWWSLIEATRGTNPPESIVRDRDDAANRVVEKLTAALSGATLKVEASEFRTFDAALDDYVDEAYPPYWHPELPRIDESHLDELRHLDADDDLPSWAQSIGVPSESTNDPALFSDLALELRKLVATELQAGAPGIDLATVLSRVGEQEPLFTVTGADGTEPAPAIQAVLWGLCRAGAFRLSTVDDAPAAVDQLLDRETYTRLTLTPIPPGPRIKDVFVDAGLIEPTASVNDGYVRFNGALRDLEGRARALADEASVQAETTFESTALVSLLAPFVETLEGIAEGAADRRDRTSTENVDTLRDLLETTRDEQATVEMAEARWTERFAFLLQLEGFVRLGEIDAPWLGAEAKTQLETLVDQLEAAADLPWWTDDGWGTFVSELDVRPGAFEALNDAWEGHEQVAEAQALSDALADHPWLVGPMDLPAHRVHDGFRVAYLDALRGFRSTVDRIHTAIEPLLDPEPGANDERALTQALGLLDDDLDWSVLSEDAVDRRRSQLEALDALVGEAAPEDVVGIGLLPKDADALRAQLNTLDLEEHPPEIDPRDGGVVIR